MMRRLIDAERTLEMVEFEVKRRELEATEPAATSIEGKGEFYKLSLVVALESKSPRHSLRGLEALRRHGTPRFE
jgi:hypothetical protein